MEEKRGLGRPIYIILRNDDPCARSNPDKERKVLELMERYHIPQVLAVIPNNVDDPHTHHSEGRTFAALEKKPQIIEILKKYHAAGLVEIAQHGYTHQTNRFRTSDDEALNDKEFYQGIDRKWIAYNPSDAGDYSEFAGLPYQEQADKIIKGQTYLEKIFGFKPESFIFPWNTYDATSLKILRQHGFKYVPVEEDQMHSPGLLLLGACNWDWYFDKFCALVDELVKSDKPALTQIAYHSWEVNDDFLKKLENFFKKAKQNPRIQFILPSQIPEKAPWMNTAIRLRGWMIRLERSIAPIRGWEEQWPRYYSPDFKYYLKNIAKFSFLKFFLKDLQRPKIKLILRVIYAFAGLTITLRALEHAFTIKHLILAVGLGYFAWLTAHLKSKYLHIALMKKTATTGSESPEKEDNKISFGSFDNSEPIGREFGADRGAPIDRLYIDKFLTKHKEHIKGVVLEFEDSAYTMKLGAKKVIRAEVINLDPGHPQATIVADIANAPQIPSNTFDCIICTQMLFLVYDYKKAVETLYRILKPKGVLLITVPGIAPVCPNEGASWHDLWRFTEASLTKLLQEFFPARNIAVETYGNIYAAISYLEGLAQEDVNIHNLEPTDPSFPINICAKAVKP